MINADYLRGYFDAHGFAYFTPTRKGTRPSPRVYCKDKDIAQAKRIHKALIGMGYHPLFYQYNPHTGHSAIEYYAIWLARYRECAQFARQIGSERPEVRKTLHSFIEFENERQ